MLAFLCALQQALVPKKFYEDLLAVTPPSLYIWRLASSWNPFVVMYEILEVLAAGFEALAIILSVNSIYGPGSVPHHAVRAAKGTKPAILYSLRANWSHSSILGGRCLLFQSLQGFFGW